MTRRSLILAASAAALRTGKGQSCGAGAAPSKLLPPVLQNASTNTLFDCSGYSSLPSTWTPNPGGVDRIPVDQLTLPANAVALSLLRNAYQLMRTDNGVTGYALQGTLHQMFCSTQQDDAHGLTGGAFLAWHRAFLYFHERLLRWQLQQAGITGADQVRLPYWDVTSFSESGGVYSMYPELGNTGGCRTWISPASADSKQAVAQLRKGLAQTDLKLCSSNIFSWHMLVHKYVGGNMAKIPYAAYDPIFFAFHASVDRMWSISKSANLVPDKHICTFFDPFTGSNGGWVQVNLANFAGNADLGVTYQDASGVAGLLLSLPVPSILEVDLPPVQTAGSALIVTAPHKEMNFGALVRPMGSHHVGSEGPSQFVILEEWETYFSGSKHDAIRVSIKDSQGVVTQVEGTHWRYVSGK
jgi:hypothetical protein